MWGGRRGGWEPFHVCVLSVATGILGGLTVKEKSWKAPKSSTAVSGLGQSAWLPWSPWRPLFENKYLTRAKWSKVLGTPRVSGPSIPVEPPLLQALSQDAYAHSPGSPHASQAARVMQPPDAWFGTLQGIKSPGVPRSGEQHSPSKLSGCLCRTPLPVRPSGPGRLGLAAS